MKPEAHDDGGSPRADPGVGDGQGASPDDEYRVGPGKPPLHSRFKKGEPSRNPGGRPRKLRRSLSLEQRTQDVARSLGQTLMVRGKPTSFSAANLELIKNSALKGSFQAQIYLDKLDQQNRQEIALQSAEIARLVSQYYRYLAEGDPPKFVIDALNDCAEQLEQLYLDPNHDPKRSRRKKNARSERESKKRMTRLEAELRAKGAWPPPGVVEMPRRSEE